MDIIYSLVTSADAYGDAYGYHSTFFEGGAFGTGILIAGVVALVLAIIYYFGMCRNISMASLPVWIGMLLVSGVVSYLISDLVVIGNEDPDSSFYANSFYESLDSQYLDLIEGAPATEQEEMNNEKNDIIENLNQGDDVAFEYSLTTALLSMLIFYVLSIILKGFGSIHGLAVPHLWPHGRK